jgi:hypothetical protein
MGNAVSLATFPRSRVSIPVARSPSRPNRQLGLRSWRPPVWAVNTVDWQQKKSLHGCGELVSYPGERPGTLLTLELLSKNPLFTIFTVLTEGLLGCLHGVVVVLVRGNPPSTLNSCLIE